MAVDVVLWFILAAIVGWIWCGCHFTAPQQRTALKRRPSEIPDSGFEQKLDRAA